MQACTPARVRALPDSFSGVPTQLLQCGSNSEGSSVCHPRNVHGQGGGGALLEACAQNLSKLRVPRGARLLQQHKVSTGSFLDLWCRAVTQLPRERVAIQFTGKLLPRASAAHTQHTHRGQRKEAQRQPCLPEEQAHARPSALNALNPQQPLCEGKGRN